MGALFLFKGCSLHPFTETTYRIGQDQRWREVDVMEKTANLATFNYQLLSLIAKQEDFRIHLSNSQQLLEDLQAGKFEGILTTLDSDDLIRHRLLFSHSYFLFGPVLIVSSKDPMDGWNERRKRIVGIPSNLLQLLHLEQDPTIQVRLYSDILEALADLRDHKIDGAIFPAIPAYTYTRAFYKNELKIVTLPLTDRGIRLATLNHEEGEELIQKFNEGLEKLKENGTYAQLLEDWGLMNIEVQKND